MASYNNTPYFPSHDVQITVAILYLICLPATSIMVHARFPFIETTKAIFRWELPYSRVTILIALFTSWCYIFVAGVLNLGVGLSHSVAECARGTFICTWFYTTTKLGVYLFLMERAFIVRGGGVRLKSWHYRFNFFLMACWLTVFVLLESGRIYSIRPDGFCTFGWQWWALIPLMSLDLFVNLYLLAMFIIPLLTNAFANRKLRSLALRSLWTALASTAATMANLAMLVMIDAPGWLCLCSCGLDIFFNAVLLFYMTRSVAREDRESPAAWTVRQQGETERITAARPGTSMQLSTNGRVQTAVHVSTEVAVRFEDAQESSPEKVQV